MRIGFATADFPVLSETFVVNDMRQAEAMGHEVAAIALGKADPSVAGNPNYAIRGKVIRVKGLNAPIWRKAQKLAGRWRLRLRRGAEFGGLYHRRPAGIPDELWRDRLSWDAALDQIDRLRLDFLHVHFGMRQLLMGYHASRVLGIPLGVTLHAHDIFINPLRPLFPHLLGQCAVIVTVSHYNKEEILRLAPALDPASVHVLPCGIDVERFRPAPHGPGRPFRFAGTGRLVEIKGFHVLVEAAGILAGRNGDFVVGIVGEGELRPKIEQRIEQLGLGGRFELLGRRDASFLGEWLPRQDCIVLPCIIGKDGNRDGMPIALREGMACGLPAISTDLLGLHETVAPGTGFLVGADDPAALADGMERMMQMDELGYRRMAELARLKAEREFSLAHEVGMLTGWMEAAVARRPRGGLSAGRLGELMPAMGPS